MEMSEMRGCKRCPTCHALPDVAVEAKVLDQPGTDIVLRCEVHGHVAMGETLKMAVNHWNRYISHVIYVAADHMLTIGPGKPGESYCSVCGTQTLSEDFPDRYECAECHAVKHWKKVS